MTGLMTAQQDDAIVLRTAVDQDATVVIPRKEIDDMSKATTSLMPNQLAAGLRNEYEFYDLVAYVLAVARGGSEAAKALQPSPQQLAIRDDSQNLDHAGILAGLNEEDLQAGRRIYFGHCVNCHGKEGNIAKLPLARAFRSQPLKFGSDPYRMFMTLTRGNGLMAPVNHLAPKERYQVVHFIRERLMKGSNPEYREIDEGYLQSLPEGTEDGEFQLGPPRDYGPVLASQLGKRIQSGLTFHLPNQVSVCYDLHRMQIADVWTDGFLNLSETHHYRQRGEGLPQIDGDVVERLGHWQWDYGNDFKIGPADKKPRGPLRSELLDYHGYYLHGDQAVLSYAIRGREVLEQVEADRGDTAITLTHTLHIAKGTAPLRLMVGSLAQDDTSGQPAQVRIVDGPATLTADDVNGDGGWDAEGVSLEATFVRDGTSSQTGFRVSVTGDVSDFKWIRDEEDRVVLTIPASDRSRIVAIHRRYHDDELQPAAVVDSQPMAEPNPRDPMQCTTGGPLRWPEELTFSGLLGDSINGYALDTIPVPIENPWNAWVRTSALDFFADGRAVVSTYGGDVYIVSGLNGDLQNVSWKRFAAGLFEPFGVRVVDEKIYVTCRDGIKRLHDLNHDGEADFIEAFWIDDDLSCNYHSFVFDLQTDSAGNFYLAKQGQGTDYNIPGAILRIPPEGKTSEVFAYGIRTPNGMGILPGDQFTISDNQGNWIPAGKISLVREGDFLGSMPVTDDQRKWMNEKYAGALPEEFRRPIVWTPQEIDNSCGGQIWVEDVRWGPLANRLIHASYGKGWLFYIDLSDQPGKRYGSIVKLPHQWDAGVMRLRVHPIDGQVYGTGISGWQGPPGGADACLQRLRFTGKPVRMIESIEIKPQTIVLQLSFAISSQEALLPEAFQAEMWNYLWSARYGSEQFKVSQPEVAGHDELTIEAVDVSPDRKKISLNLPDLTECDQLRLRMHLQDANGQSFREEVHLTINELEE